MRSEGGGGGWAHLLALENDRFKSSSKGIITQSYNYCSKTTQLNIAATNTNGVQAPMHRASVVLK